jgi:ABC-type glycerol-3-phosphate transport system substrate-binding protein
MTRLRRRAVLMAAGLAWGFLMSVGPVLAQTTELTMWTFIDPAGTNVRSKSLAQVLKTFEAKNPAIKVKPNVIEWTQISPSLLRASQARQVPDLVMLYSPFVAGHVAAGTITPLDELLAKDGRDNYVIFPEGIDAQGHVFAVPMRCAWADSCTTARSSRRPARSRRRRWMT